MKKVVVFGGGTGISYLLSGLKLFPIDVTAVITVSDDGRSTGQLKKELDIPAVGDIGQVLISMSNVDDDFKELLKYRFTKESFLEDHPVKNILLAALIDIKGNLLDATKYMCKLLNVKGTILPLTEEKVDLVGEGKHGETYLGEQSITNNVKRIKTISYDHDIKICSEVIKKINEADLIIFSPGSLFTSIIPHLISPKIRETLNKSKAPIMYVSNLVSQPGETDGFTVGDHLDTLNKYLDGRKIDVIIANKSNVDKGIAKKYLNLEHKSLVHLDERKIKKSGTRVIAGDIVNLEDGRIRHNSMKTAYLIFSYLMEGE